MAEPPSCPSDPLSEAHHHNALGRKPETNGYHFDQGLSRCSDKTNIQTDLETYFCRSLGLTLITLAVLTILLTGSVPLTSTFADGMLPNTSASPHINAQY